MIPSNKSWPSTQRHSDYGKDTRWSKHCFDVRSACRPTRGRLSCLCSTYDNSLKSLVFYRPYFSFLTAFRPMSLLHFPPMSPTPAFSTPAYSTPAVYSRFFHSCFFSVPALTIYPCQILVHQTLTVLNSNFLQLGRRSGDRPQRTVYPRWLPVNCDTHYVSRH